MEIKKVKWRKPIGEIIVTPSDGKSIKSEKTKIDIGTHPYGVCEKDKQREYVFLTITDKRNNKFIAVVDTFDPAQKTSSISGLSVGDYVEITEEEISRNNSQ